MDKQQEASDYLGKDVTVFLINGVKLSGVITKANAQSLKLSRDGTTQTVFYHAVATILPSNG